MATVNVETRSCKQLFGKPATAQHRAVLTVDDFDGCPREFGTAWTDDKDAAERAAADLRAKYGPDFNGVGMAWEP
jgi:hypothetical protein